MSAGAGFSRVRFSQRVSPADPSSFLGSDNGILILFFGGSLAGAAGLPAGGFGFVAGFFVSGFIGPPCFCEGTGRALSLGLSVVDDGAKLASGSRNAGP